MYVKKKTTTSESPESDSADNMIRHGEIMVKIGNALKPFDEETRRRIIKAVCALYGIEADWRR